MSAQSSGRGAAARASRSQVAYHSLRDDIFAFRLLPGDRFTASDVAERLGISRAPVREALQRLQGDGLVAVLFVLLSGVVFLGWGEIFPLFPSTLTDRKGGGRLAAAPAVAASFLLSKRPCSAGASAPAFPLHRAWRWRSPPSRSSFCRWRR